MTANAISRGGSALERQPHPSPHRQRVTRSAGWFGLLAAPSAYCLQELVNVSLAGHACYPRDVPLATPLWPDLASIEIWIGVAAIVICIAASIVAFVNWRRSRTEKPGDGRQLIGSGDGRTRFMAMAGMMVSVLFLIAVGISTMNITMVPPCGG